VADILAAAGYAKRRAGSRRASSWLRAAISRRS
jgi:hypothetical protein